MSDIIKITKICGAAGVLAAHLTATAPAHAADLGGDCCADLEERVADLEATAARKGNRRMSLTVSGQVSRSILYWSSSYNFSAPDAPSRGVYAGLDNSNQSTRFVLSGSAKVTSNLAAGFEFMTEWTGNTSGAGTSVVNQLSPDGSSVGADGALAVRTANWWLEDRNLGRLTVGRLNVGGPVTTIDLGGIGTVANPSPTRVGGNYFVAGSILGRLVGPSYGEDRIEGIRYDSPNIGGFVAQSSWGENEVWGASLRYAGEFGGIRVAAGIGYEAQNFNGADQYQLDVPPFRSMDNEWAASLALMHVASGLFVQGHYARSEYLNGFDARIWMAQGGITKNWLGVGNTSIYGEYGKATDYGTEGRGANLTLPPDPGTRTEVNFVGLGAVQQIDAAAMEIFLGWRRFEVDRSTDTSHYTGHLDFIHGGARIRF